MDKKTFGISSFTLRLFAMAFMLCDHIWATLVPGNMWMTCVGRLAFPIFAFLLVEGFHHTASRKKYALRLLIFAVLSEVPFNLMYERSVINPFHQNVLWTLLLGFLGMWGMERLKEKRLWLRILGTAGIALLGWLAGTVGMVDYFGAGVLTVLIFYLFRGRKWWQLLGQAAGLYWVNFVLLAGLFIPVELFGYYIELPQQGFAILSLLFIWLYRGRQGPHSRAARWTFYAFYPCHMLLLALLGRLMG